MVVKMTDRNLKYELQYHYYEDMEDGNDTETINYDCLIGLLKEILTRLEKLEEQK
jgi:hypothetical protein